MRIIRVVFSCLICLAILGVASVDAKTIQLNVADQSGVFDEDQQFETFGSVSFATNVVDAPTNAVLLADYSFGNWTPTVDYAYAKTTWKGVFEDDEFNLGSTIEDFSSAFINGADFTDAKFNMGGKEFHDAVFSNANFTGCTFSGDGDRMFGGAVGLGSCTLSGASIQVGRNIFNGTELEGVDFRGVTFVEGNYARTFVTASADENTIFANMDFGQMEFTDGLATAVTFPSNSVPLVDGSNCSFGAVETADALHPSPESFEAAGWRTTNMPSSDVIEPDLHDQEGLFTTDQPNTDFGTASFAGGALNANFDNCTWSTDVNQAYVNATWSGSFRSNVFFINNEKAWQYSSAIQNADFSDSVFHIVPDSDGQRLFQKVDFVNVDFSGTTFKGAGELAFLIAKFYNVDFTDADLRGACTSRSFSKCAWTDCTFGRTRFAIANKLFYKADLRNLDFREGIYLRESNSGKQIVFFDCDFNSNSVLANVDFSQAGFEGGIVSNTLEGTPTVDATSCTFGTNDNPDSLGPVVYQSLDAFKTAGWNVITNGPTFSSNVVEATIAAAGKSYTYDLNSDLTPPAGETVTFSKLSGPEWLSVSSNGIMTGTPASSDFGVNSFEINAQAGGGAFATVIVNVSENGQIGAETSFGVSDDTYADEELVSTNWGSNAKMMIRSYTGANRYPYLKFDVDLTNQIDSVRLRLLAAGNLTAAPVLIYAVEDNSWSEDTLVWTNRPSMDMDNLIDSQLGADQGWMEFDLSSYVTNGGVYSVGLKWDLDADSTRGIWSSESTNTFEDHPEVLVDYRVKAPTNTPAMQYNNWASERGLSGADAGGTANPDGDNWPNLMEYGLGGNPTNAAGDSAVAPIFTKNAGGGVEYIYRRRRDADSRGLTYLLNLRDNADSGSWTNGGYSELEPGLIDADFEAVTNVIPGDTERKFIRLEVDMD